MMQEFICHKKVRAVKIKAVRPFEMPQFNKPVCRGSIILGSACGHCERCKVYREVGPDPGALIIPTEGESFQVSGAYMRKHSPKEGGYFVVYEDGYQSFSPAEAFEQGYTRA